MANDPKDSELQTKRKAERTRRNKVAETIVCKDCGQKFPLKVGEVEFYEKLKFPRPKRCSACRTLKKAGGR